MADDGRKPPLLTPYPGRARTQPGDRDVYRVKTPPMGVPVLPQWEEDVTGKYEGEDLERARARKPTAARLAKLEDKHDKLADIVGGLRQTVGEVSGKLDVLPQLVEAVKEASDRVQEREHLRVVTDIQVDGATKMGGVKAKLMRGEQWSKVLAILGTGAAIVLALIEARRC